MRFIVLTLAAFLVAGPANAEWKTVAKSDSKLLLVTPFPETTREVFEDSGWSTSARTSAAYAAAVPPSGSYPRVQVYLHQVAPLTYWRRGSVMDAAWIKQSFPFTKDKEVQVTSQAPPSDAFLRVTHFTMGTASCVAFEMREITNDTGGSGAPGARDSVSGIYCPSAGTAPSDALTRQVTEGIFVRRDGKIERILRGVNAPLPAQLSQTNNR